MHKPTVAPADEGCQERNHRTEGDQNGNLGTIEARELWCECASKYLPSPPIVPCTYIFMVIVLPDMDVEEPSPMSIPEWSMVVEVVVVVVVMRVERRTTKAI
jgi:hypothetical protein